MRALARELPVLGSVGRVLRRSVRRRFPLPLLSDSQVGLLRTVERMPGISSGAVADHLQVAPSTASTLLRELLDLGLVRREVDDRDRRASRLWLTDAARDGLGVWATVREEVVEAALLRLSEQDRRVLAEALPAVRRLVDELEASG